MLLLARAFTLIDWKNIQKALPTIEIWWLLLTLVLLWLSNVLSGVRWGKIMQSSGFPHPTIEYVRWYFSGGLINQGLPTTLGGDSYRAISAYNAFSTSIPLNEQINRSKQLPNLKSSFFNVALDRSLGFAGNSILGAIGLGIGGAVMSDWLSSAGWILTWIMILGAGVIALIISIKPSKMIIERIFQRLQIQQGIKSIESAWGWPNVIFQIPLAIMIHIFTLMAFWACIRACHLDAPIEALLIGIPAVSILMILPISISGWGLRETSLVGILGLWHLDPSLIILSSLLYGLITLITLLPGLLRLVVKKKST